MTQFASVEVTRDLLEHLRRPPLSSQLEITSVMPMDGDYVALTVSSPALAPDAGHQELYLDGDTVKFKPWRDA